MTLNHNLLVFSLQKVDSIMINTLYCSVDTHHYYDIGQGMLFLPTSAKNVFLVLLYILTTS